MCSSSRPVAGTPSTVQTTLRATGPLPADQAWERYADLDRWPPLGAPDLRGCRLRAGTAPAASRARGHGARGRARARPVRGPRRGRAGPHLVVARPRRAGRPAPSTTGSRTSAPAAPAPGCAPRAPPSSSCPTPRWPSSRCTRCCWSGDRGDHQAADHQRHPPARAPADPTGPARPRLGGRSTPPTSWCTPATGWTPSCSTRSRIGRRAWSPAGATTTATRCGPGCPETAVAEIDGLRLAVTHETGAVAGRERRCDARFGPGRRHPRRRPRVRAQPHPVGLDDPRRRPAAQPRLAHRAPA